MNNQYIDLVGMRFGRLVVLHKEESYVSPKGDTKVRWLCRCDCGNEKIIHGASLKRGLTISCGCYNKEKNKLMDYSNRNNNKYNVDGSYGVGYTAKGEEFYFDLEDYENIKKYSWSILSNGYVNAYDKNTKKTIRLHQVVMNSNSNDIIDHINRNKCDNRKENLRFSTKSQNNFNRCVGKNNTSGVTGVSWSNKDKRWVAILKNKNNMLLLKYCINKEDAIKARLEAELKYFGKDFAPQRSLFIQYGIEADNAN